MESRSSRELLPGVNELVSWLVEQWPTKKDEWEFEIWVRKINVLVRQCGLGPVWRAAEQALISKPFLPEAPELYELLPAPDALPRQWHDEDCPDCHGTGWKPVPEIDSRSGRVENPYQRCPCKPSRVKRKIKAEPAEEAQAEHLLQEQISRLQKHTYESAAHRAPGELASSDRPLDPNAAWKRRQELRAQAEGIAAARRQKLEERLQVSLEGKTVQ